VIAADALLDVKMCHVTFACLQLSLICLNWI